jgi:hypothetical protein
MAIYIIQELLSSPRSNGENNIMRYNASEIKTDMDLAFPTKEVPFVSGLKARMAQQIKTLQARFSGKPVPSSINIDSNRGADGWAQYYQGFNLDALPPRDNFLIK